MSEHIDEASAALADRSRPQVANHVRTVERQTLDALLRLEEVLTSILNGLRHFAAQQGPKVADAPQEAPKPRGRR